MAEKTCERIARENNVSASSVRRAALFAKGVDLAEDLCPGIRRQVLSGHLKAPSVLFEQLAKAKPKEYNAILEQIKNPQPKAKPAVRQKLPPSEKEASELPLETPRSDESKSVLEEPSLVYSQLADAAAAMRESWENLFEQMPALLTSPEQREVVQSILEKHLAYLASLGFDLTLRDKSEQPS